MRVLLDTHTVLWWVDGSDRLSILARQVLADPETRSVLSVVTAWEIATKCHLGRLRIPGTPEEFLDHVAKELATTVLPIELAHVLQATSLPLYHRDPFDRLLMSQAMLEQIPILTIDRHLARYPVHVLW